MNVGATILHRQWLAQTPPPRLSRGAAALAVAMAMSGCFPSTGSGLPDAGPACSDVRVDDQTADFLNRWTDPQALDSDTCVLPGRHGPAPEFDTAPLGEQQPLRPGDLPEDTLLPPPTANPQPLVAQYPIVHLGQLGDSDNHVFLAWRGATGARACVGAIAGVCGTSEEPGEPPGVLAYGRQSFEVWVPPKTSVVALDVDGHPEAWQQPVARTAILTAPLTWATHEDYARFHEQGMDAQITYLDTHGSTIATDEVTVEW